MSEALARIVAGSLTGGLTAQLLNEVSPERVRASSVVAIQGKEATFLGVVSDIALGLGVELARSLTRQETRTSSVMGRVIDRSASKLKSQGSLPSDLTLVPLAVAWGDEVEIADTLPDYTAFVTTPGVGDVKRFYGLVDQQRRWPLGTLKSPVVGKSLGDSVPVDVDILARGSFGIFGKSGSGKTFVGNLLASYIILSNYTGGLEKRIKLLIFDMHSEYGLKLKDQIGRDYEDGVGLAFKEEFTRYTPDHGLARESGLEPFTISSSRITIQDIYTMAEALGISSTFLDVLPAVVRLISETLPGRQWIEVLCNYNMDKESDSQLKTAFKELGAGALQSFLAARNRLERLTQFEFINWVGEEDSAIAAVDALLRRGQSVILTFGRYGDNRVAYMLVANIVSRRLWNECVQLIMEGRQIENRVVIFLEEAHKFLSPSVYYMTPFGDIARELRKRGVVLCVLDQRPSELTEEVRAMLWNTFDMWLTEVSDIEVASKGLPFPKLLTPVIANLRRQEVLAFGEAVRIPAVVRTPDYKTAMSQLKELYRNISDKRSDAARLQGYG